MPTFPDPNDSTEYTDPNGSVWAFNGTGWVRQCDCPDGGGGDGGDGGDPEPTDPYWNETRLLINADGLPDGSQEIVDVTGYRPPTVVNAPAASTEQFKYGDASVRFINTTGKGHIEVDKISYNNPFTFEAWVRRAKTFTSQQGTIFFSLAPERGVVHCLDRQWIVRQSGHKPQNQPQRKRIDFEQIGATQTVLDEWHHVAFCWDGSRYSLYVDGVRDIDYASTTRLYGSTTTPLALGSAETTSNGGYQHYMDGWIDDIRVTQGVCRYPTEFTPPDKAPTKQTPAKARVVLGVEPETIIGDNDVEDFK